jgi:hypothetical protein
LDKKCGADERCKEEEGIEEETVEVGTGNLVVRVEVTGVDGWVIEVMVGERDCVVDENGNERE